MSYTIVGLGDIAKVSIAWSDSAYTQNMVLYPMLYWTYTE